jgi:hypothetical protein
VLIALAAPVWPGLEPAPGPLDELGTAAVADDLHQVPGRVVAVARVSLELAEDEIDFFVSQVKPAQDEARVGGGAGQS